MSNINSLILYYSVFGCSILASFMYQQRAQNTKFLYRKVFYFLLVTLPVIIMQAFRYNVGTDYHAYNVLFSEIIKGPNNYVYKSYHKEPLYLLENIISYKLFGDSTGLFLINAIIECVFIFLALDYFKDKISMPMGYVLCYFMIYPSFFNMERQAVATAIVWFSLRFLVEKKFIKFMICILVAACFHNTAIIALALYLIHYIRKVLSDKRVWVIIGVIVLIIVFRLKEITVFVMNIIPRLAVYNLYVLDSNQGVSMAFISQVLLLLPCLIFLSSLKKNEGYTNIYIYLYLIDVMILVIASFTAYGIRLMTYFNISIIILISMTCNSLKNKANRMFIKSAYVIALMVYFYLLFYVTGTHEIFPYQILEMGR
ncbi:MAG: EpsG family protein [Bacteroides sp.]|nr:EpsG family protein [Bacteroides sp.]